ncbi:PIG-L family deacetylase [Spongisporangium articulatum]|uniref:PIG-L family deacetylase n=1 Tax=Spongisporangium articulatum TaxID=3362603 RepID=A0ABW8AQ96_9ACTN
MSGLLVVHAHPDDETITQGATLALHAAAGAGVTVVTCTRGEQGEVIPPELAHLFGSPELGAWRVGELHAALAALGVRDHRFLDGDRPPLYVDSGMAYAADGSVVPVPSPPDGAFALADLEAAALRLAAVLRDAEPDAVVTYDPVGGYGHPDHVRAHHVTMRAVELVPVPRVYWIVDEARATTSVDGTAFVAAKVAALRAHATQVTVADDEQTFALSNAVPHPLSAVEHYRLVRGTPVPGPLL